ncbi:hypothetical protein EDB86DRAFT_2898099 [Lactarius hatsudake]|nr:hypothetical protein EDB86DRAFT_2898099 [Lactarius hatsudake]
MPKRDVATNHTHDGGYPKNPYLSYRPVFARSLPIQILINGITLTLVCILLVQLLFTAPYHIRLARVNFFLQLSAAVVLLASEIASLTLLLNDTMRQSQNWPFMLEYIAFDLPPLNDPRIEAGWPQGGLITWLFMNALVSALTQITHIQFLSLMYPSRLEAQLIFLLLGPLAILAAGMQLAPLHPSQQFNNVASAVRNVCNATLSILFTLSLGIWGFVVNRKQAWRTDGGTAAFGVGAILLALAYTALTISYIPSRDQFEWVPGLTGAVILWQSFFGWWWWVGAGMGIGEVGEWLRRSEKRRKRRATRDARRKEHKERFRGAWNAIAGGGRATTSAVEKATSSTTTVMRGRSSDTDSLPASSQSGDTSTRGQNDAQINGKYWPWSLAHRAYRYVCNAHVSAARRRAMERAEHIREVFGVDGPPADVPANAGWGLGSFGVREREREAAGTAYEMEGAERLIRHTQSRETEGVVAEEEERTERTTRREREPQHRQPGANQTPEETNSSLWWWGPLRRWRHQDTTEYAER